MARVLVLYNLPTDPDAFERHYAEIHAPLAKAIPGLRSYTVSRGPVMTPAGPSSIHLIATLEFDDIAAIQTAFATPEGQRTAADVPNFATGGSQMMFFDDAAAWRQPKVRFFRRSPLRLNAGEQKLVDDVAQYGWHVMKVSSRADEPYEPPFAYTIGLDATFGWPELICYGLDIDVMAKLLNNAVDELKGGSRPPAEGMILTGVVTDFECRLVPVAQRHHKDHLGFAIWYARYRGLQASSVRCLQLVWPDREGLYPFESGCSQGVKDMQPLLSD